MTDKSLFKFYLESYDLIEIQADLSHLKQYLAFIREQYEVQKKGAADKRRDDTIQIEEAYPRDEYDRSDHSSEFYAELDLIEKEYEYVVNVHWLQLLVHPFIVSVWSVHESVIRRLSTVIRNRIKNLNPDSPIEKKVTDMKGGYFNERAQRYFEQILGCPFGLTDDREERLYDLSGLRNAIVHQNSWVDSERTEDLREKIESGKIEGVTIWHGALVIDLNYAECAINLVTEHLEELISIVKERYPSIHGRSKKGQKPKRELL